MNRSQNLRSDLGVISGTSLAVSLIVGVGVFSVVGMAVEMAGATGSTLGWICSALIVAPFVLLFHRLGVLYKGKGSLANYATNALGGWSRCSVQLLFLGNYILIVPVAALIGISYLERVFGIPESMHASLIFSILLLAMAMNLMGTRFVTLFSRLSSISLLIIAFYLNIYYFDLAKLGFTNLVYHLNSSGLPSFPEMWTLCAFLFYAFLGWENVSITSVEMKNPKRTMGQIYLLSYVVVIGIYFGLALVVSGAQASNINIQGTAGIVTLLQALPFGSLFTGIILLVILSNITSWFYISSRMVYSASRSQIFSKGFSKLNHHQVPHNGLLYMFVACAIVLVVQHVSGTGVAGLIKMCSQNFLVVYSLCLVEYVKVEKSSMKWFVAAPTLISIAILVSGLSWYIVYPLSIILLGLMPSQSPIVVRDRFA